MELHVVETEGLPEGSILSVRAGSTRRQAPVSADRPFRFPSAPGGTQPFKVDVLAPVASARLVFRPGEERRTDCQYTIPLEPTAGPGEESGMSVTLAVKTTEEQKDFDAKREAERQRELELQGDKRSIGGSSASSRLGQASAARDYLDQHNLVEFTQLLVQSVIKEQPDKPFAFMAKQFYFPDPEPLGATRDPSASHPTPAALQAPRPAAPQAPQPAAQAAVPQPPPGSPPAGEPPAPVGERAEPLPEAPPADEPPSAGEPPPGAPPAGEPPAARKPPALEKAEEAAPAGEPPQGAPPAGEPPGPEPAEALRESTGAAAPEAALVAEAPET